MNQIIKLIPLFLLAMSTTARAFEPVKDVAELKVAGTWEKIYRVKTAKVMWLNYDLVRKDFGKAVANLSNAQIDKWMLDQVAYISETQVEHGEKNGVNTNIEVDRNDFKKAYRPPTYGRALVYQTDGGLIDGKGAGTMPSRLPQNDGHGNGLAPLGEMVREVMMSQTVADVFARDGGVYDVVASYGVIDWGFDINASLEEVGSEGVDRALNEADDLAAKTKSDRLIKEAGELHGPKKYPKILAPAGMVLRQAHPRIDSGGGAGYANGQMTNKQTRGIEMTLAKYGLTSGSVRQVDGDIHVGDYTVANVQGVRGGLKKNNGAMVDFGTITAINENHRAVYGYSNLDDLDDPARAALSKPIISHADLIQPDPKLRVPWRTFGRVLPWRNMDFIDSPRIMSDWLVFKWRKGLANSNDVSRLYSHLTSPLKRRWARADGKGFFASGCWRDVIGKAGFFIPIAATPFVYKAIQNNAAAAIKAPEFINPGDIEPRDFKVSGELKK